MSIPEIHHALDFFNMKSIVYSRHGEISRSQYLLFKPDD